MQALIKDAWTFAVQVPLVPNQAKEFFAYGMPDCTLQLISFSVSKGPGVILSSIRIGNRMCQMSAGRSANGFRLEPRMFATPRDRIEVRGRYDGSLPAFCMVRFLGHRVSA